MTGNKQEGLDFLGKLHNRKEQFFFGGGGDKLKISFANFASNALSFFSAEVYIEELSVYIRSVNVKDRADVQVADHSLP